VRLDPRCPATLAIHPPPAVAAHVEKLAGQLWTDLLDRPGKPLDWQGQHRFYLELESTIGGRLRRRIRQLAILAIRLISADYEFAARFGVHQTALVWALRQFRLLARLCGVDLNAANRSDGGNKP
jgi:hypothetical protein